MVTDDRAAMRDELSRMLELDAELDDQAIPDPSHAGSRPCGCRWELIPASETLRRPPNASGPGVRFLERCDEHAVMCRNLEQWEMELGR